MERFSERDIEYARDRFFPNWWLHRVSDGRMDVTDRPSYWVVCDSEQERDLALASKPHFLNVRVTVVSRR